MRYINLSTILVYRIVSKKVNFNDKECKMLALINLIILPLKKISATDHLNEKKLFLTLQVKKI